MQINVVSLFIKVQSSLHSSCKQSLVNSMLIHNFFKKLPASRLKCNFHCNLLQDAEDEADFASDLWVRRVESMTEDLQRSNAYWQNNMIASDYIVRRDQ